MTGKEIRWRDFTASGILSKYHCEIHQIILTPDATNAITVQIREGSGVASGVIHTLLSLSNKSLSVLYPKGFYIADGAYITITCSGTAHVMVFFSSAQH